MATDIVMIVFFVLVTNSFTFYQVFAKTLFFPHKQIFCQRAFWICQKHFVTKKHFSCSISLFRSLCKIYYFYLVLGAWPKMHGHSYEYDTVIQEICEKLKHETVDRTLLQHKYDTPNKLSVLLRAWLGFCVYSGYHSLQLLKVEYLEYKVILKYWSRRISY